LSRYLEAAVGGVLFTTLYAPNGNQQPGSKSTHERAWMKRLLKHAAEFCAIDAPVVLAGESGKTEPRSRACLLGGPELEIVRLGLGVQNDAKCRVAQRGSS
jgi:hypothetical protein